ncbi:hypothetical protein SI65_03479 [Aspergillus cristatus]|uniref:aminodeoxychorismate synthase n=1 Tax=Aspergillus cristatus TaxID=573508 RepID=A0A1E3BJ69_ASPCR|nr:hypothetical protein SI65_03479 [Aspergillus cristatus]
MAPLLGSWTPPETGESPCPSIEHNAPRKSILYIDAYDSFSYNVVAMLEEVLNVKVTVMTIDSGWPDGNITEFLQHYEAVVLGPGPGDPQVPKDVGIMKDIWNLGEADMLPVFGICLGFQSLCLHHGISIGRLPYPLHGQVHRISTAREDVFDGMRDLRVTLYHSLYAKLDDCEASVEGQTGLSKLGGELDLLAWLFIDSTETEAGTQIPMAIRHRSKPFWGVQFHPESCKSDREACDQLLKRWWEMVLNFNERTGRGGYGTLPDTLVTRSDDVASLPDAAFTMLKWSASTSRKSACRTFSQNDLTAEAICETLNTPGSPTVLFQSNGRYSIISVSSPGSWRLEYYSASGKLLLEDLRNRGVREDTTLVEKSLSVSQFWDALRYLMEMKRVDNGDHTVPFWGGFLGYFSYEMGLACLARPKDAEAMHNGFQERHSSRGATADDPADASLLWTDRSIVVDNQTGRVIVQSTRESDDVPAGWLDQTLQSLNKLLTANILTQDDNVIADGQTLDTILNQGDITFPSPQSYIKQVEACKAELEAGESYELCLTCETSITLPSPNTNSGRANFPWKLYKRLRKYNPAAFSAYAKLGNVKIVSSSPECFLNWDRESTLEMKPMKGTVRKTDDMTMEKAREILGSTKEVAENLMIADLIRHDLYGICGSGNVYVEKLLEVEDHGRVFQMITHVKGDVNSRRLGPAVRDMPQLQTSSMAVHGLTALQRCLPPGSMTGAPKERSCMHLSSIEDRKRGIYSGAMGYLDLGGGGSFSVLIRTAFTSSDDKDEKQLWRIGAGGAVTTLSTAEGEWDEMLTKLRTVCNIFTPLDSEGRGRL